MIQELIGKSCAKYKSKLTGKCFHPSEILSQSVTNRLMCQNNAALSDKKNVGYVQLKSNFSNEIPLFNSL